jgi:hypothetical protein
MKKSGVFILVLVTLVFFIHSVDVRAELLPVSSVTASSTWPSYDVKNLINGSGLSGDLHSGLWPYKWLTNQEVTGWLDFDLGASASLASTKIWNYGPGCCGNERSVKDLNVYGSNDDINFSLLANLVLQKPSDSVDPFPGEVFTLTGNYRYIKFDILSNYDIFSDYDYTGLSEVQFYGEIGPAPVPEPATMLLLGSGLIGLAGYGRKKIFKK